MRFKILRPRKGWRKGGDNTATILPNSKNEVMGLLDLCRIIFRVNRLVVSKEMFCHDLPPSTKILHVYRGKLRSISRSPSREGEVQFVRSADGTTYE